MACNQKHSFDLTARSVTSCGLSFSFPVNTASLGLIIQNLLVRCWWFLVHPFWPTAFVPSLLIWTSVKSHRRYNVTLVAKWQLCFYNVCGEICHVNMLTIIVRSKIIFLLLMPNIPACNLLLCPLQFFILFLRNIHSWEGTCKVIFCTTV